jgi:hypothetical protein
MTTDTATSSTTSNTEIDQPTKDTAMHTTHTAHTTTGAGRPERRTPTAAVALARLASTLVATAAAALVALGVAATLTTGDTTTAPSAASAHPAAGPVSLAEHHPATALVRTVAFTIPTGPAPAAAPTRADCPDRWTDLNSVRDHDRNQDRGDRAHDVFRAGPVEIQIGLDVAARCARTRTDNRDRDQDEERDWGRAHRSSADRDECPCPSERRDGHVLYYPSPSTNPGAGGYYPSGGYLPGRGYLPGGGYRYGPREGYRPGEQVCRQVAPGAQPELPAGGLVCVSAEGAGW